MATFFSNFDTVDLDWLAMNREHGGLDTAVPSVQGRHKPLLGKLRIHSHGIFPLPVSPSHLEFGQP